MGPSAVTAVLSVKHYNKKPLDATRLLWRHCFVCAGDCLRNGWSSIHKGAVWKLKDKLYMLSVYFECNRQRRLSTQAPWPVRLCPSAACICDICGQLAEPPDETLDIVLYYGQPTPAVHSCQPHRKLGFASAVCAAYVTVDVRL